MDIEGKEYIVRGQVNTIRDNYDFVIIDCPPSLSMLTVNAMTTADSVIVPILCLRRIKSVNTYNHFSEEKIESELGYGRCRFHYV